MHITQHASLHHTTYSTRLVNTTGAHHSTYLSASHNIQHQARQQYRCTSLNMPLHLATYSTRLGNTTGAHHSTNLSHNIYNQATPQVHITQNASLHHTTYRTMLGNTTGAHHSTCLSASHNIDHQARQHHRCTSLNIPLCITQHIAPCRVGNTTGRHHSTYLSASHNI